MEVLFLYAVLMAHITSVITRRWRFLTGRMVTTFTMILADHLQWYMPEFKHELMPINDEWTTVTTSLSEFTQYRMTNYGEAATDKELDEETLSEVIRIELRNSNFASGDFELEIDYIEFQGFIEE